jgi:hypothetical protein
MIVFFFLWLWAFASMVMTAFVTSWIIGTTPDIITFVTNALLISGLIATIVSPEAETKR